MEAARGMTAAVTRGVREGPRYTITLDRADVRNALDARVFAELHEHLDVVEREPAIRVVVVTGAGDKAFSAGADLQALEALTHDAQGTHAFLAAAQRLFRRLETMGKPVVAALNGHALGGGLELALACTFVLAHEGARVGLPEAQLGLIPGIGGTQRLVRRAGHAVALRMMLTGELVSADEAYRWGLVDAAPVAPGGLDALVAEWTERLTTASPWSVRLILESVRAASAVTEATLAHETALASLAAVSPDAGEGVRAFREKRSPEFR